VIAGDPLKERSATYEAFVAGESAHLRRVLVAHFGIDVGAEVTADALTYACPVTELEAFVECRQEQVEVDFLLVEPTAR
jgi:hypothetical protein